MANPTATTTAAALHGLAIDAVDHVVAALATTTGSAGMTLGERGSAFCRDDMHADVELLAVARRA